MENMLLGIFQKVLFTISSVRALKLEILHCLLAFLDLWDVTLFT